MSTEDKEIDFWTGYQRIRAKEESEILPPVSAFIKGNPYRILKKERRLSPLHTFYDFIVWDNGFPCQNYKNKNSKMEHKLLLPLYSCLFRPKRIGV